MNDEEICFPFGQNFNYMLTYFHLFYLSLKLSRWFSAILICTNKRKKLHNVTCCGCFLLLCLFSFSRLLDDRWWWLLKFIVSFTKTKSMQRRYKISNLSNTSIMKLMVHLFRLFGIMSSIKYNKLNLQDLSSWFYSFNSTVFDMNEKFLVIWWTFNWRMRPNTDLI